MAVITAVATQVATSEERTWRATIETPKGVPYSVDLHREKRDLDAQGVQVGEKVILPDHHLLFDVIKPETITLSVPFVLNGQPASGALTLSVELLCGFISAYFDQKAAQLNAAG